MTLLITILGLAVTTYAGTFFDNFNDGNADGWWLGYSHHTGVAGNWRVEDGILLQDQGGDGFIALVENLPISNQSIETQLMHKGYSGYGGVTIWYQDRYNWIAVRIYPAADGVWVNESINGGGTESYYPHLFSVYEAIWYNLRVDVDSANGKLAVYLDDTYLFTYDANTPYRTGLSGLFSGNTGAYFDNFSLTSTDIPPIPEPAAVLLIGSGLLGLAGLRRKFKK